MNDLDRTRRQVTAKFFKADQELRRAGDQAREAWTAGGDDEWWRVSDTAYNLAEMVHRALERIERGPTGARGSPP